MSREAARATGCRRQSFASVREDEKASRTKGGRAEGSEGTEFARRGSASRIARIGRRSCDYCKMSALVWRTCLITTIIYPSTCGILVPQGGHSTRGHRNDSPSKKELNKKNGQNKEHGDIRIFSTLLYPYSCLTSQLCRILLVISSDNASAAAEISFDGLPQVFRPIRRDTGVSAYDTCTGPQKWTTHRRRSCRSQ
jgi:hypothetical protein